MIALLVLLIKVAPCFDGGATGDVTVHFTRKLVGPPTLCLFYGCWEGSLLETTY
jgi:hypothetical protein